MFQERLQNYRNDLGLTKREMADRLDISEGYYNLIENGKRSPSKSFIEKLTLDSERPEEFWIYGVNEKDYIDVREDFKCIQKAAEQIIELGLVNDVNKLFNGNYPEGTLEELLIVALKTDLEYLVKKRDKK
ncbi:helix-turn-helix transcriptional regulator [Clostridium sp. C2-6-12]|uniref:helix-turn-helix domain-containing protein n=1 Tax=Clostridium sp. C2-6-12 TaxID=2698832 RepID=UPI00136CABB3|nr:helix-turn-helix transcriptional regulator [Clostridium sp. C2-6-12]